MWPLVGKLREIIISSTTPWGDYDAWYLYYMYMIELVAHVRSNLRLLICWRRLMRSWAIKNWTSFLRKAPFSPSCMRAYHVLSYHLVKVPWYDGTMIEDVLFQRKTGSGSDPQEKLDLLRHLTNYYVRSIYLEGGIAIIVLFTMRKNALYLSNIHI